MTVAGVAAIRRVVTAKTVLVHLRVVVEVTVGRAAHLVIVVVVVGVVVTVAATFEQTVVVRGSGVSVSV